jgi:hypothetical protein
MHSHTTWYYDLMWLVASVYLMFLPCWEIIQYRTGYCHGGRSLSWLRRCGFVSVFLIGFISSWIIIKPYIGMGIISTAEHFDANHIEPAKGFPSTAWTVRCYGTMLSTTGCVLNWEHPLPCEKRIVKFCDFWFPPEMEK